MTETRLRLAKRNTVLAPCLYRPRAVPGAGEAGSRAQIDAVSTLSISGLSCSQGQLPLRQAPPRLSRSRGKGEFLFPTVSTGLRGSGCWAGTNNMCSFPYSSLFPPLGICSRRQPFYEDGFLLCFLKSQPSFRADLWRGLPSPFSLKWFFSLLFWGPTTLCS